MFNLKQTKQREETNEKTIVKTNTVENAKGVYRDGRNEDSVDPGMAFRRSSLLLRSPPAKGAASMKTTGSGSARTAIRETIVDSPVNGNRRTDDGTQRKDAVSTSTGRPQPVQHTPTTTFSVAGSLVTPTSANGGTVTITTKKSAPTEAIELSPRLELIRKMRRMEEDAIAQCKLVITSMQQAFKRQKNISNDVKVGASKLAELLDVTLNYRRSWKAAEDGRASSSLRRSAAIQPTAETPTLAAIISKRTATSPAAPESCKKARANESSGAKKGPPGNKEEGWQTVAKRGNQKKPKDKKGEPNKKSKPRTQHAKPEAVGIKPTEGHSYAEVLKDLRAKITTDDSVKVRSVRKTKAGAILLEFGRGEKLRRSLCAS